MLCHIVKFQNESYVCKYVAKLNRFFFIVLRTESYSCYWVCFADVLCYYRKTKALKTTIVHDSAFFYKKKKINKTKDDNDCILE